MAIQLQEEENRRAAAAGAPASQQHQRQPAQRTQSAPVGGAASQKKKEKDVSKSHKYSAWSSGQDNFGFSEQVFRRVLISHSIYEAKVVEL